MLLQCEEYRKRRDALCGGFLFHRLECAGQRRRHVCLGALYPEGFEDDTASSSMELMEKTGVLCTPGSSFGELGKRTCTFRPPPYLAEETIRGGCGSSQKEPESFQITGERQISGRGKEKQPVGYPGPVARKKNEKRKNPPTGIDRGRIPLYWISATGI